MTILITGGAGFVGAHLTKKLIDNGYDIIIVDNLNTIGGIPYVHPKATFYKDDICDESLYKKLKKHKIEVIYHLAAQSGGEPSYENPKYDILTNSLGTYLMAKFAKEMNIPRFIYTSTVAIYGANAKGDTHEDIPSAPDSIYGVSKLSGEFFVQQLLTNSETKYSTFRIFNSYGPGEDLNYMKKGMISIYSAFIWKNEPIMVKGSLERYRDFTYIEDTVDVLYLSMMNQNTFNNTYNLSSGKKTVIKDLLTKIKEVMSHSSYSVQVIDGTPGDTFGFHANISKLERDLNWTPRFDLDTGLRKFYEWIKQVPNDEDLKPFHPILLENK